MMDIKVLYLFLLITIGNVVKGQTFAVENFKNEKVLKRLNSFHKVYKESLSNKQFNKLMEYYDGDVMSMPEYQASLINKENVTKYYSLLTKRFTIKTFDRTLVEIIDLDNRLIEIGDFSTSYHLIEKDTTYQLKGSYLNIWEQSKNGDLKLLVESWNYRHDVKDRAMFTFSELEKSSWNDSFLKIDTSSIAFELAALNELMVKTVSTHNPTIWSQFFSSDAKYIYSHTPVQKGKTEITHHLIDHCKYLPTFDQLLIGNNKIEVLDDYVIEYASHYVDWSYGAIKGISTGKDLRIWKRMPDCSLKIFRQIAMYDN